MGIGFYIERNEDDTLAIWFSDENYCESVDEEHIDSIVFGYKKDKDKIQAFSLEELYTLSARESQCH